MHICFHCRASWTMVKESDLMQGAEVSSFSPGSSNNKPQPVPAPRKSQSNAPNNSRGGSRQGWVILIFNFFHIIPLQPYDWLKCFLWNPRHEFVGTLSAYSWSRIPQNETGWRINPCPRILKNADFRGVVSAKSVLNCQIYTLQDISAESEGLQAQKCVCSDLACRCTVMMKIFQKLWRKRSFHRFCWKFPLNFLKWVKKCNSSSCLKRGVEKINFSAEFFSAQISSPSNSVVTLQQEAFILELGQCLGCPLTGDHSLTTTLSNRFSSIGGLF